MTNPTLSQITIYPIKSTRGIHVSSSWVDSIGLPFDRRFVVCDNAGKFITARTLPKLCLIQTNLTPTGLVLTAPDMPILLVDYDKLVDQYQHVSVWQDTLLGQRCEQAVDAWFSQYIGKGCHLLFFGEQSKRVVKNHTNPVAFADGYPLLLISQGALNDLNSRLAVSVSMQQFRPNIVVDNCEPFAEDSWYHIRIGEVEFEISKPCTRCVFTTINPHTGEKHPKQEPLNTLKQYRKTAKGDVIFGQNLIPLNKGQIKQGDEVVILREQKPILFSTAKQQTPATKHEDHLDANTTHSSTTPKQVKVLFDSWNKEISANTEETLLEQAENSGLILPYSCRAGMCGSCKVKLANGTVKQLANDALTSAEKEAGYVLACSCVPTSDLVISKS